MLVSFADDGIAGRVANGMETTIYAAYVALSWDEGEKWPVVRVLSDVRGGVKNVVMCPWDKEVSRHPIEDRPDAYWAATQSPNGMIHLSDSRLMYTFNLAWLLYGYETETSLIEITNEVEQGSLLC